MVLAHSFSNRLNDESLKTKSSPRHFRSFYYKISYSSQFFSTYLHTISKIFWRSFVELDELYHLLFWTNFLFHRLHSEKFVTRYSPIHITIGTNVKVTFSHIRTITTQNYFDGVVMISSSPTTLFYIKFTFYGGIIYKNTIETSFTYIVHTFLYVLNSKRFYF